MITAYLLDNTKYSKNKDMRNQFNKKVKVNGSSQNLGNNESEADLDYF